VKARDVRGLDLTCLAQSVRPLARARTLRRVGAKRGGGNDALGSLLSARRQAAHATTCGRRTQGWATRPTSTGAPSAEEVAKSPALLDIELTAAPSETSEENEGARYEIKDTRAVEPAVLVSGAGSLASVSSDWVVISAEEEGFEPTVPLRVRRFSKPVP
jgi:hypothetical protein